MASRGNRTDPQIRFMWCGIWHNTQTLGWKERYVDVAFLATSECDAAKSSSTSWAHLYHHRVVTYNSFIGGVYLFAVHGLSERTTVQTSSIYCEQEKPAHCHGSLLLRLGTHQIQNRTRDAHKISPHGNMTKRTPAMN